MIFFNKSWKWWVAVEWPWRNVGIPQVFYFLLFPVLHVNSSRTFLFCFTFEPSLSVMVGYKTTMPYQGFLPAFPLLSEPSIYVVSSPPHRAQAELPASLHPTSESSPWPQAYHRGPKGCLPPLTQTLTLSKASRPRPGAVCLHFTLWAKHTYSKASERGTWGSSPWEFFSVRLHTESSSSR